ncbi:ATP synthase subunit O, mitochondrial-like [Mizuhopecten yessoensis]|uniref:Oligomycin sensitivity conferral protein n=1 Tax=Mizuhopecten yessoensis TaxID=6573 RepID=A0A210QEE8_MIZYE|nr:ATP synthase subunit O, mitochondrial-like [Mizuhopecten yessoensis]OWF47122.1 ATP synthase subunit O, mitochondrial [Mizuhopecten yessoensis]
MASLKFGQGVRHFSSTAVKHKLIKPPVQVYGIEGRYATALFSAASKKKALPAVEKDLNSLSKILATDIKFRDFLYDPTQKGQHKQVLLKKVADREKFSEVTVNLFGALADNKRFNKLAGVTTSFNTIMAAERGEVPCTVTVAKSLDASTQKELTRILSDFLKKGESLVLTTKVDPTLIGGMRVDFTDKSVDMSMASRLGKYADLVSQPV